jgi:hypothetical protein
MMMLSMTTAPKAFRDVSGTVQSPRAAFLPAPVSAARDAHPPLRQPRDDGPLRLGASKNPAASTRAESVQRAPFGKRQNLIIPAVKDWQVLPFRSRVRPLYLKGSHR